MNESAVDSHRMLSNAYGKAAISERTRRKWFQRIKNGDFNVEDQHGGEREKDFEDAELEAILDQYSCQTQQKLAGSLKVTQQAILKHLKFMGMIQKQGYFHFVPYELKPSDVERHLFACEQLLARQRQKGFLHHIVSGGENGFITINPSVENHGNIPGHATMSTAKPNIHGSKVMLSIWLDQIGVVYYELLKPTETITVDRYRTQLIGLSRALRKKRPQ